MDSGFRTIVARPSPRPDLLVFEVRDKIDQPDIEWMSREVEGAFDSFEDVDLLLIMTNFDGAELSAVVDVQAIRAMTRSLKHVRKYGVVGAPAWARLLITFFDVLSPVNAKTFDLEDEHAAWVWMQSPDER